MKISNISIKNYRSCPRTEFSPHSELSVFIGPNGSGKTTILSVISLLSSLCYIRSRRLHEGDLPSSISEIKVSYDWNGKKITHTAKLEILTNDRNENEIIGSEETWNMPGITEKKSISAPIEMFYDIFSERHFNKKRKGRWHTHYWS